MFGTADLTHGIPGKGPLKTEEIKKWLADPKNMAVLKPLLPMGLSAGAGQIAGLEENPTDAGEDRAGSAIVFRYAAFERQHGELRELPFARVRLCEEHAVRRWAPKDKRGSRNSPVAYNRILSSVQFWDGRAATLEEQAKGPIANPIEMSNTHDVCVDVPRETSKVTRFSSTKCFRAKA